jgi:hypothetical protein
MHHLECRFDHALLREQLAAVNIAAMNPFFDFPFLKQASTEGERWPVQRERPERLRAGGLITDEQFQKFTTEGGSKDSISTRSVSSSLKPIRANRRAWQERRGMGSVTSLNWDATEGVPPQDSFARLRMTH